MANQRIRIDCVSFVARQLNLLALGSDVATSLGINIRLTRALTYIAVVLLTASSVAIAGPIGFVGMLVPHIAKGLSVTTL